MTTKEVYAEMVRRYPALQVSAWHWIDTEKDGTMREHFSVQQDKPHNHSEFGTSFEDALAKFKPATVNTKELREKAAELLAEAEAAEKMQAGVEKGAA